MKTIAPSVLVGNVVLLTFLLNRINNQMGANLAILFYNWCTTSVTLN